MVSRLTAILGFLSRDWMYHLMNVYMARNTLVNCDDFLVLNLFPFGNLFHDECGAENWLGWRRASSEAQACSSSISPPPDFKFSPAFVFAALLCCKLTSPHEYHSLEIPPLTLSQHQGTQNALPLMPSYGLERKTPASGLSWPSSRVTSLLSVKAWTELTRLELIKGCRGHQRCLKLTAIFCIKSTWGFQRYLAKFYCNWNLAVSAQTYPSE